MRWLLPIGLDYGYPQNKSGKKPHEGQMDGDIRGEMSGVKAIVIQEESESGKTSFVGKYSPQGDSSYGCVDMSGNIWEWTASRYKPILNRPEVTRRQLGRYSRMHSCSRWYEDGDPSSRSYMAMGFV